MLAQFWISICTPSLQRLMSPNLYKAKVAPPLLSSDLRLHRYIAGLWRYENALQALQAVARRRLCLLSV